MRARLALTVLAVTGMVMIAFLLPLGAVVRTAAEDRAGAAADQEARSLASVLAAVTDPPRLQVVIDQLNSANERSAAVYLPDGARIGPAINGAPSELALAQAGRAFTSAAGGDRRVWIPVRGNDGAVTVGVVHVPGSALHKGVLRAWIVLGALGAVIVAFGTALADRLGSSMVRSVQRLEDVTRRLHDGDLAARVEPEGPSEIVDVGIAVNELADRIEDLLAAEREAVADLSHRLRTPLTALALEAEALPPGADRDRVTAGVTAVADAVSELIREVRRQRPDAAAARADMAAVTRDRLAFWAVLAEDQGRSWRHDAPPGPLPVRLAPDTLAAAVDALIANVFTHTDEGVAFRVCVTVDGADVVLAVEDEGPGIAQAASTRGRSGAGSTGLGLDIARKAAAAAGGTLVIGRPPGGRVELRMPLR